MIEAILLGTAQDGGVPHAGCDCPNCLAAWINPALQQHPTCMGLVDHTARRFWLIDATPSFPVQLHSLIFNPQSSISYNPYSLSGISLTHAHIGHYTGLIYLGQEVMNTDHLPVYGSRRLVAFLRDNAPWSGLVMDGNIDLVELEPDRELVLSADLHITPIPVPHRDEYSDTMAYLVQGPKRSLFFCPDIDAFHEQGWHASVLASAMHADIALLDGTFFSSAELPGRDLSLIPHPFVTDTMAKLTSGGAQAPATNVFFIHLNHSNPLWQDGPEQASLEKHGFRVGSFGQCWEL